MKMNFNVKLMSYISCKDVSAPNVVGSVPLTPAPVVSPFDDTIIRYKYMTL